jgi:hypothetical protein
VNYLIDTYGEAKFTSFIRAVNDGLTAEALRKTYNLGGIDALEDAWRKAVGLSDRPTVTASGNASIGGAFPTIVPFGAPGSTARDAGPPSGNPDSAGDDAAVSASGADGGASPLIIAGALVAVVVVLAACVVVRLLRKQGPPAPIQ